MGCGSSKDTEASERPARQRRQQGAALTIGAPQEVSIHMPRNRDQHGVPLPNISRDVDRQTLEAALGIMARYLSQKHANLTAVAVGGAVNTIFLRTRNSTHDVDIFGTSLDTPSRILLDEAMQVAIQQRPSLVTDWINTENQMWLSPTLHRELTQEAIQQNVVVFREPGLTILAAPWEYAFSGKIARLLTGGDQIRPYDLADAVHYLNQIVRKSGGHPVPVATIEAWSRRFHHNTARSYLMNSVNAAYRGQYNANGIV